MLVFLAKARYMIVINLVIAVLGVMVAMIFAINCTADSFTRGDPWIQDGTMSFLHWWYVLELDHR